MIQKKPNTQYTLAKPNSIQIRIALRQRRVMYERFLSLTGVEPEETILDVGVTSDQTYSSSNYLEAWYPHKATITACGIDDASFLETLFPGIRFVRADGVVLPFADRSFDVVHSSAVLEHVGSYERQTRFIRECTRVARRAVFLTTPNRWFPIEVHTSLPLVHWLPKPIFRKIMIRIGLDFFAMEENLNLMSGNELKKISETIPDFELHTARVRLSGWTSNLLQIGERRSTKA